MRFFKLSYSLIIILILLSAPFHSLDAAEVDNLGKFCFDMYSHQHDDAARSLQFDLFSFNGTYYPVHGSVSFEGVEQSAVVYGIALKDNENIVMTLTGTHEMWSLDSITIHAVFGIAGGEYHTLEHGIRWSTIPPNTVEPFIDTGVLIPRPCP